MCGSRPLQGLKSRVGIEPDCQPNRELGLLFGKLTLGHFLVGREVVLVQVSQNFAFLHSDASVFSQALFVQIGAPFLSALFPPVAPFLSALFPPGVDQLQIQV